MNSETLKTSSVGACWPPAESSHERIRGFYPEIIRDETQADSLTEQLAVFQSEFETEPETTRLSIRAVVADDIIEQIGTLAATMPIESAMPLFINRTSAFHIVYFGRNKQLRQVEAEEISDHTTRIISATEKEIYASDPSQDLLQQGYIAEKYSELNANDVFNDVCRLYSKFGYDIQDTYDLLNNPSNSVVFARDHETGRVVSTVMAEHANIDMEDETLPVLRVCEFTEAITDPDMRKMGLYKKLSTFLRQSLELDGEEPVHAVYGESNLSSIGVINSAHQTGRTFSRLDTRYEALRVGTDSFGILQQNFKVIDGYETRAYNDFAVSYYDLANIRAMSE
ncbi:MAG: hypothetical protein NTV95_01915 [Candidatus Saccharibacteria bacterium]|nr:hypothetical protein [Candidatus Saccharibacteria bacterium]